MRAFLTWVSYGIYAFVYLGLLLHTSGNPQFLGKYSAKYTVLLAVAALGVLPWRWATRFLLSDSKIAMKSGRTFVFKSSHKILFYAILFGSVALCAEGYLRITYVNPGRDYLGSFHPYLQNRLDPKDEELHVNRHGFRGEEIYRDKADGTFRIFLLGGSTVLSSRVDYEKSHARLLELSLQESNGNRKIEVLNAGNHWHTSQHSVIKYLFKLRDFEPDLVIVWHGINDLYRSFSPPKFARYEFEPDYSHFYGPISRLVLGYKERSSPKPLLSGESLLINTALSQNTLYSDLSDDEPQIEYIDVNSFPSLVPFKRNMREIARAVTGDGTRLVFATQPHMYRRGLSDDEQAMLAFAQNFCVNARGQAPNFESMIEGMRLFNEATREIAAESGVPLIDLEAKIPKDSECFADDVHYTEVGNALVAESISEFLLSTELLN